MLGLRTSRRGFGNRHSSVAVTLDPMVHVGGERFYKDAYDDAVSHDVAVVERVLQPKAPAQAAVSARIVRADLTAEELHREWRKLSLSLRAVLVVPGPLVAVHPRFSGRRERLARQLSLEYLQSANETSR